MFFLFLIVNNLMSVSSIMKMNQIGLGITRLKMTSMDEVTSRSTNAKALMMRGKPNCPVTWSVSYYVIGMLKA